MINAILTIPHLYENIVATVIEIAAKIATVQASKATVILYPRRYLFAAVFFERA